MMFPSDNTVEEAFSTAFSGLLAEPGDAEHEWTYLRTECDFKSEEIEELLELASDMAKKLFTLFEIHGFLENKINKWAAFFEEHADYTQASYDGILEGDYIEVVIKGYDEMFLAFEIMLEYMIRQQRRKKRDNQISENDEGAGPSQLGKEDGTTANGDS